MRIGFSYVPLFGVDLILLVFGLVLMWLWIAVSLVAFIAILFFINSFSFLLSCGFLLVLGSFHSFLFHIIIFGGSAKIII
jgi:hypothetical protein